jgi:molecular chaperone GrpE
MPRRKKAQQAKQAPAAEPETGEAPSADAAAEQAATPPGGAVIEDDAAASSGEAAVGPPEAEVERLKGELEALNDRYLRLAAEFDNYRKRVTREREQLRAQAQADLVRDVLEAVDDLARVTGHDANHGSVDDVIAGVELVERKLMAELERLGLKRVGVEGAAFDPNEHEAVGTMPAPAPEQDGTVAAVLQVGYRFGGMLLRPARVVVFMEAEA